MGEKLLAVNRQKIDLQGARYYEGLREALEPSNKGKIVAINPDNGEYFLGQTVLEAVKKGREKYPECVFYIAKVGYPAVYSFR